MPRKPRLFLPDMPQHVVVRGHNREPVFARHDDFRFFYRCLLEAADSYGVSVHAWVLMHNHIHLLLTPEDASSLPRTMQTVGRRYAQYFNRSYHRSGALWEGRYKASVVDTDQYLLSCYRYIEMNPVRAGMVKQPEDYPYSSYHVNALGKEDKLVSPHRCYLGLVGSDEISLVSTAKIQTAYRCLFDEPLTRKTLAAIRRGTESALGIGQADFLLRIASLMGRAG